MERLVKGNVIVTAFPFSDLSASKHRPAFVLKVAGDDIVLCEITSKQRHSDDINLTEADFQQGKLRVESWLRPLRLFTAHRSRILYSVGSLKAKKVHDIVEKVCSLLGKHEENLG